MFSDTTSSALKTLMTSMHHLFILERFGAVFSSFCEAHILELSFLGVGAFCKLFPSSKSIWQSLEVNRRCELLLRKFPFRKMFLSISFVAFET